MATVSPLPGSLERFRLNGIRDTGRTVGDGAYATVLEYDFRGLKCVGKKIHSLLYQHASQAQKADMLRRFREECELLSQLHHPNIVQFLGIHVEVGSVLPALVMEYLPTTLANYLEPPEPRQNALPTETSYEILRDVALGLRYLHEHMPPIIHRDLSANNVLLTASLSAKISDLGVAKILNISPSQMSKTSTQAPGTPCYMPPEALADQQHYKYTSKTDSYSFGVLCLHVLCGEWPFPSASFQPDPRNPDVFVAVSEVDRRMKFLQQIGAEHPLRALVCQCLSNSPRTRPEAVDILQQLSTVMSATPEVMFRQLEGLRSENERLGTEIGELNTANESLRREMHEKDIVNASLRSENRELITANIGLGIENASLTSDNQLLRHDVQTLQEENQRLGNENQKIGSERTSLRQEVQSLRKESQALCEHTKSQPSAMSCSITDSAGNHPHETEKPLTSEAEVVCGHVRTPILESQSDTSDRRPCDSPPPQSPSRHIDVALIRSDKGLGFSIAGGRGNQHVLGDDGVFITKIISGGPAEEDSSLSIGDRILQVNGQSMVDVTHKEAVAILKSTQDRVVLQVEQNKPAEFGQFKERLQHLQETQTQQPSDTAVASPPSPEVSSPAPAKQLYVRALFDYDSSRDDDRPSQGLSFKHGDILHILNSSDDEWWQAALVGNQGHVPSKKRTEQRHRGNQKSVKFTRTESTTQQDRKLSASEKRGPRTSSKLFKKIPFLKKREPATDDSKQQETKVEEEHIPTYEPVSLEPRGYAHPVIVLGPLREDINHMLVQEFPDKFAGCVPYTTRQPRDGEVDGRDYHFVSSVEQMERDIQAHLFIEASRYKEVLYGTSIKAVQEVASQGKHCILGVSGYAIRRLQMADLHPIAVCVRPTGVDVISSAQPKNSETMCKHIFEKGQRTEQEFMEYFTAVVEGDSLADIYNKVKNVIHEQSGPLIWVPSSETL